MGNIIATILTSYFRSTCSADERIEHGIFLIDELCSKIAAGDTATALDIMKSVLNVNKVSKLYGLSPLHMAVEAGNLKCIEALLNHSADVNIKDCRLFSPLHIAAGASQATAACIQILLDAGSDINATDIWGKTALHRAVICARYEASCLLMENPNCNVNAKDSLDRTCLMYLAHCPMLEYKLLQKLMIHGADVNQKDKKGRSALYFAVLSRQLDLVSSLIQEGSDLTDEQPLKLAVTHCFEDCVHLLLEKGSTLSLDTIQSVLSRFECGHRIDRPMLDSLQKHVHLLKLLLSVYGWPLSLEFIKHTIVELFVFINALKHQTSLAPDVLASELSQVVPIICLLVSVNSIPLQTLQPLLSMFDEYSLLQRVRTALGYNDVPPLTIYCRTLIRGKLAANNANLLCTINKLSAVPSPIRCFILAKEFLC